MLDELLLFNWIFAFTLIIIMIISGWIHDDEEEKEKKVYVLTIYPGVNEKGLLEAIETYVLTHSMGGSCCEM